MGSPERTAGSAATSGGAFKPRFAASWVAGVEDCRGPRILCERRYHRNAMGCATRFRATPATLPCSIRPSGSGWLICMDGQGMRAAVGPRLCHLLLTARFGGRRARSSSAAARQLLCLQHLPQVSSWIQGASVLTGPPVGSIVARSYCVRAGG